MMLFVASIGLNAQTVTQEYTFDSDVEGWIAGGGASVAHEAAIGFTALGALNLTANANKIAKQLAATADGNGDYTLTYKARSIVSGSTIRTQYRDDSGSGSIQLGDTALDGTENGIDGEGWTTVTHTFTLTGGESTVRFELKNSSGATETFYIDDMKLEKAAVVGSTLDVTTVGGGVIEYTPIKAGYDVTDIVTLTATPSTHWNFGAWTGDLTSTNAIENITMDADKTVTGTFIIDPAFDYKFMFETPGDSEGWTENAGTVLVEGGVLKYNTNVEAYARLELHNFPIPADNYNWVRVKMMNQTTGDDNLRFITSVGSFNITTSNGDTAEQTYEFALDTLGTIGGTLPTTWTGNVNDLQFRFGVESTGKSVGGDYLISSIEFYKAPTLSNESITKDDTQLSIYPNPVRNTLSVKASAKVNGLQIYNVTGQEVLRASEATINTSSLSKGVYIIRVSQEGGMISTKRFIKE